MLAPGASLAPNQSITQGATEALRGSAMSGSSALLGLAGTVSIIFFVAFFVLAGGERLVNHFLGLWSYSAAAHEHATGAWKECTRQIRWYAGVLLVTNTVVGLAVWLAFEMADLPDSAGWGITAALLHVAPYLGMALLTALGAAATLLVHETIGAALGMAAFLVLVSKVVAEHTRGGLRLAALMRG